jgi:hypothetical protein
MLLKNASSYSTSFSGCLGLLKLRMKRITSGSPTMRELSPGIGTPNGFRLNCAVVLQNLALTQSGSKCANILWNSAMFDGVSYEHTNSNRFHKSTTAGFL